jgi:hypothetical protein
MSTRDVTTGYDHDDPSLKAGDGGLTVWDLQKMASDKRFDELDELFDNGLTMNALPVGYSAGAGVGTFGLSTKLIDEALEAFVGKNWRGKIFFSSNNKRVSEGRNRLRANFLRSRSPIVPMLRLDATLVDSHPLAPRAKSNLVIVSYTQPLTRPYWQEQLVTKISAIDIQVAVRGKYGPVWLGKTWFGKYDKTGKFTASNPNNVVGRYYLDFNEEALKDQRENHWDGSEEELLDPLPHLDN